MKKFMLAVLVVFTIALLEGSNAEPQSPEDAINHLYENLLQREYAGPISFPNHQVERKAQRSPSLRLRFGRSDPGMLQSAEKRWFGGDVRQKPIRSPSLRLRFGRRSDPSVPLRSYDGEWEENINNFLTNEEENNQQSGTDQTLSPSITRESLRVLLNTLLNSRYEQLETDSSSEFNRETRKPLRLRFGRSTANLHRADDQPDAIGATTKPAETVTLEV